MARRRTAAHEVERAPVRAVAAVQRWAMYDLPWTSLHPAEPPVHTGSTFATVVRHLGFWSINPCRGSRRTTGPRR
ncbi:DUF1990 family protein [Longimicrobium sp.]|uniref:DUF1990 family protein n=1 Tax=Longimicrobium sp. TaxID=2029185 RepID=UPI0039C97D89